MDPNRSRRWQQLERQDQLLPTGCKIGLRMIFRILKTVGQVESSNSSFTRIESAWNSNSGSTRRVLISKFNGFGTRLWRNPPKEFFKKIINLWGKNKTRKERTNQLVYMWFYTSVKQVNAETVVYNQAWENLLGWMYIHKKDLLNWNGFLFFWRLQINGGNTWVYLNINLVDKPYCLP